MALSTVKTITMVTKEEGERIITSLSEGLFIYEDGNRFVGIDNLDGNSYAEPFDCVETTVRWLQEDLDHEDLKWSAKNKCWVEI